MREKIEGKARVVRNNEEIVEVMREIGECIRMMNGKKKSVKEVNMEVSPPVREGGEREYEDKYSQMPVNKEKM